MAVYTEVPDDELADFIASYDVGELLSYKGIAEGVENTNYLLHAEKGQFILTIYEKRVDQADLPFFLGLMDHLARSGFTCPTPVRDAKGAGPAHAGGPAGRARHLPRGPVGAPPAGAPLRGGRRGDGAHASGRGRLRPAARQCARSLPGWRPLFERFRARADEITPGLAAVIEQELAHQEAHWPADLPQGVIHADLFPDNVFFLGDALSGVIDFYFACNDALIYDVAVALNAWCFETDHSFNITKGQALLKGYRSVRPISPREREVLPLLARGSALRFLLTRAYDWLHTPKDALVKPHDPHRIPAPPQIPPPVRTADDYGWEAAP